MGLAVHPVDDQIAPVAQFVGQPLCGDAAEDGSAVVARLEYRQLARLAAHGPLHGADDVAALAQGAQGLFGVGMDGPGARLHFVGQAQALQALQPADQQQALALQPRFVEPFDMHQAIVAQLALERAIRLVHRSCSTSRCKVCWISSSVRGPSHSVASSAARWRKPSAM